MKKQTPYPEVIRKFSKTVVAKRYAIDMTQENMAEAVGIHVNTLMNIEKGYANPSLTIALKISKILGISLDEMMLLVANEIDV